MTVARWRAMEGDKKREEEIDSIFKFQRTRTNKFWSRIINSMPIIHVPCHMHYFPYKFFFAQLPICLTFPKLCIYSPALFPFILCTSIQCANGRLFFFHSMQMHYFIFPFAWIPEICIHNINNFPVNKIMNVLVYQNYKYSSIQYTILHSIKSK